MSVVGSTIIAPPQVSIVDTETPKPLVSADGLVTNGGVVVVFSTSVPVTKIWKMRRLSVQCRCSGYFTVFVNGLRIAKLLTSSASENPSFIFDPYHKALSGETILVEFTQSGAPNGADIAAVLSLTEI